MCIDDEVVGALMYYSCNQNIKTIAIFNIAVGHHSCTQFSTENLGMYY